MSATATRRSTRRTAAAAASTEAALSASEQSSQQGTPPPEVPKKKARKTKATSTKAEPQVVIESQQTVTKTRASSRANTTSTSAATTATTQTSTVTAQAPPTGRKLTRAARAAHVKAGGQASPQRSLEQVRPVKRARSAAPTKDTSVKRQATSAKSTRKSVVNDEENEDDLGPFFTAEFDSDIFDSSDPIPQPVFTNGSESALALLQKIEESAKETMRGEPASSNNDTHADNSVDAVPSQSQSVKRTFTEATATPDRSVEKSNIFSRSFSAIKSRLFSSTPKPPPTPEVASPTPTRSLPPQDSLTETLSLPPTPVGERVQTPSKKRALGNTMMKILLKGIDQEDKRKAEDWARRAIPELRNDSNFREKRRRLETPVLCKDLVHFPAAKPWETGFGDPLGDLDDDDVVPVWAVYLEMKTEEEEHAAKKQKRATVSSAEDEIPTIDEQFAASNSMRTSQKLYDSHGQSTSLYDLHPRRSIDPSPMFSNSLSHSEGGNIFSELQGHENAAKIRENDREILKNATKETVNTQTQSSVGLSFSVPDDSDDEDSTADAETSETETPAGEANPIWTQPPPPAPVPAHAPLPGGSPTEPPLSPPSQQPVDEVARQRQRLMKHTPAKPSRLREATYPSPSVFSDAGNESLLAATPAPVAASAVSMFDDMPAAQTIELDAEEKAALEELIDSDEYKKQLAANWPAATLTYESDEEELSPIST
ncbi:hypothetical protein COCSADRAFT_217339 [Bipolaris sorokiniana ND90Pr]|uniref:Uncharacterized protein n=1 Tax=Cochliobolus sativus (strain ND90Pr / ATCC 201652) TaxID=665912 RepID=M2T6V4_COCSN|nr:uncharacterized protein COCSADRAFT_217339 [Bipolaris sorokiniana ND90Pr]EMD70125.1 hypothetical protein COCSADRAFT_217339 [Bipolaris sorokiniana ND90Pr]